MSFNSGLFQLHRNGLFLAEGKNGFKPQRGDLFKIETQIWILSNTNRTDARRFLCSCVNTDFRQINYLKTDIHRLTKLSHENLLLQAKCQICPASLQG